MTVKIIIKSLLFTAVLMSSFAMKASDEQHDHSHETVNVSCGEAYHGEYHKGHEHEMSYTDHVMHHISDANEIHLWGNVHIPLPCILYSKKEGLTFTMSSAFEHGHKVINGYVLDHGDVKRIACDEAAAALKHIDFTETRVSNDKVYSYYAIADGKEYLLEKPATLFSLGSANWFDLSITKNVANMLLASVLLFLVFGSIKRAYETRDGKAPKGIQSFF